MNSSPPGEPFNPASLFNNAVSNIISLLVMGKRFEYSDHNFQTMLKYLSEAIQLEGSVWGMVSQQYPSLFFTGSQGGWRWGHQNNHRVDINKDNYLNTINLSCMTFDCGRKSENQVKTQANRENMQTPHRLWESILHHQLRDRCL